MEINLTPKYTRKTFVDGAKNMVEVLAREITQLEKTVDDLTDECNEVHEQMENYKALYEQEKAERQRLEANGNFEKDCYIGMLKVQLHNNDCLIQELRDEITRLKEKEVRTARQVEYGRC